MSEVYEILLMRRDMREAEEDKHRIVYRTLVKSYDKSGVIHRQLEVRHRRDILWLQRKWVRICCQNCENSFFDSGSNMGTNTFSL
jgi:hypothetical protein